MVFTCQNQTFEYRIETLFHILSCFSLISQKQRLYRSNASSITSKFHDSFHFGSKSSIYVFQALLVETQGEAIPQLLSFMFVKMSSFSLKFQHITLKSFFSNLRSVGKKFCHQKQFRIVFFQKFRLISVGCCEYCNRRIYTLFL